MPEYWKLSAQIKAMYEEVQRHAGKLSPRGASNEFNETEPQAILVTMLGEVPCEELAHAMKVIYRCGHWDNKEVGRVPFKRDKHGGYWKFERLAKQSLINRHFVWQEHDSIADQFMDHEEGTDYDNVEVAEFLSPLLGDAFAGCKVDHINHRVKDRPDIKRHPFCIGLEHFPKNDWEHSIAPRQAPCHICKMPYDDHVSDRVVILKRKPDRSVTKLEPFELLTLRSEVVQKVLTEHKLDGFAFTR